jgi:hypothetical protein
MLWSSWKVSRWIVVVVMFNGNLYRLVPTQPKHLAPR